MCRPLRALRPLAQRGSAAFCRIVLALSGGLSSAGATEPPQADLAVLDAQIVTLDAACPQAEALAVIGERVAAVGSSEAIRAWIGPQTRVLSARGKTIVPGFNDAHLHPSPQFDEMSPLGAIDCDPQAVRTLDELIDKLQAKAARTPPGQWILGERYQDTKLGRHPTRQDLDRASTRHPIYLSHSSGHVAAVNSLALELARVTAETPDPRGGAFDRDSAGRPTGVLRERACGMVRGAGPASPEPTAAEWIEGIRRQFDAYLARGVTSVQHAGTTLATVRKYALAQQAGRQVRIYAMLREREIDELARLAEAGELGDEWLKLGAVKHFHGNSLSGQTCWLYEPYANRPDYYGIPPAASQEQLNAVVQRIHDAGLQACIHANGDREIDMVLNAYEAALQAQPQADHRHRIEHASIVNDRILDRVKELGIVLAPHSYVWEHGDKMEAYGAARWAWMHPNGEAIRRGIPVAGNSDSPVSAAHPLLRIQSMVTRTSAEGKTYGPEQRVSVEEALRVWTLGSAYASFEETRKGRLAPGMLADFVVLAADPRAIHAGELRHIEVDATFVGGVARYVRDERLLAAAETPAAAATLPPGQRLIGPLGPGPSRENSGIVRSRTSDDLFWMHNDSGDEPRVYAVRRDGSVYGSERYSDVPGVLVGNGINVDWEDLTALSDGTLVVADVGNNRNDRRDLVLYVIDEPSPLAGRTAARQRVFVKYPDQREFPAPRSNFNFDCEAIVALQDRIYLLTKHRSDQNTRVYRLNDLSEGATRTLEFLQEFPLGGQAVAADALPDGSRLVVATYETLWLFDVVDVDRPLAQPVAKFDFFGDQVEAVCFDGPERVLLADEADAVLYEVPLDAFTPLGAPATPATTAPSTPP